MSSFLQSSNAMTTSSADTAPTKQSLLPPPPPAMTSTAANTSSAATHSRPHRRAVFATTPEIQCKERSRAVSERESSRQQEGENNIISLEKFCADNLDLHSHATFSS